GRHPLRKNCRPPRWPFNPDVFDVELYVGQHRAKPIEPTTQRLLVVARPAQCMIAREVMSHVWYQNLQHLVVVVILDIGETLSHEFLDKVAVDHCFAPYALTNFVSGLIPFVHISSSSFSLAHPGAQYRGSTLGLPSLLGKTRVASV